MSYFLGQLKANGRHRARRNYHVIYEPLETRSLLSLSLLSFLIPSPPASHPPVLPQALSSELPKNASGRIIGLYELSLTKHPLYQTIKSGQVLKAPMFYASYTGPKRADLDVIGASAYVNAQQQIQLTGQVLGLIDESQTTVFSFLINRGGAISPGPIKGQPQILFDAIVEVTTGPTGTTGTVSLLNSQRVLTSTTALSTSLVQIKGTQIKVEVPLILLPSSGVQHTNEAPSNYSFAFSTSVPGSAESDMAGLAPDYRMAMVGKFTVRSR